MVNLSTWLFGPADDFLSDRLCRRYGVIVLVGVAAVMTYGLTRNDALVCWMPENFVDTWAMYSTATCWNKGTVKKAQYYFGGYIPKEHEDEDKMLEFNINKVKYFPVLLLLMTLLFLTPRALYNLFGNLSGFSTQSLVNSLHQTTPAASTCSGLAARVTAYLSSPLPFLASAKTILGGYWLTIVYGVTKLFYIVCCIIQFAIISVYFGINFFSYPINHSLLSTAQPDNHTIVEKESFPSTVMCDFRVR